ncbi:Receptor-like protein kinase FERONIA, partial [Cucurbita argyrosperma subsp. sororia]
MGPNDTRNKRYNLTWVYPVDPGFFYMIRLHFCEFQEEINDTYDDRVFLIYIANTIAETSADVFGWAGGKGIPYYRDYAVNMPHNNGEKKVSLSVKLQANPDNWRTRFTNVILNGIEIFKLNDSSGNLAGQNPDPPPTLPLLPPTPQSRKSDRKMVGVLIPAVVGGATATLALGLFVFCRRRTFSDQTSSDGTSWWAPYSISTNKSSKTRNSNLPSDLCRYFSLAEIKSATKNFDDIFIIGVGGFGNVYKGYVDDGATLVAIKRASSDDEQPLTWNQRLQTCIGAARGLHYLHTVANTRVLLTEWVKQCIHEKKVTEMVDPILQNQIGTECFRKFVQVMVSCIQDEGNKRPSMNDVVRGLEYAYQLQESSKEDSVELSSLDNEDGWLLREGMSSNTSIEMNENSSNVYNNGMSGIVSSLQAR